MNKFEKAYSIIPEKTFDKVVFRLVNEFGLPEIQRKLSVYAFDSYENQMHVNFIDLRCDIKYIASKSSSEAPVPPIFIENNNLKQLFDTVNLLGFQKANVGVIVSLNFRINDDLRISLSQDTFADNVAEIKVDSENKLSFQKVKSIFEELKLNLIDRKVLKKHINSKVIIPELLFDQFGCLNSKIRKYGEMVGIDVLSNTKTLRNRIKKFSNDYSIYEEWFTKIIKGTLNGTTKSTRDISRFFKPLSVIIPCFNSDGSILRSLFSIESQNLTDDQKKEIEVILVDDGSIVPVQNLIKQHRSKFTFNIKIIRLENNCGLSTARNVGILTSKNDHIVLMDSDILLPNNYLLEHSVRNQIIPHAVFVSLKKNIDLSSEIVNIDNIKKGLESPTEIDDLRVAKDVSKNQLGVHQFNESATLQILSDTDYFKTFGFGRTIGVFDLATMVIGHNLSTRRKTLDKCKYFSSTFVGWGLEDSYFGAKLIANGNYVIPVLSSNVYHINHKSRSGSQTKKTVEFKNNIKIYNNLLDQDFE